MFLQTIYETNGKEVERYINLLQVVSMGDEEGLRKAQGYCTVLFMPNGYAMFSKLTTQEILALTN